MLSAFDLLHTEAKRADHDVLFGVALGRGVSLDAVA
jgi:hypothetical protein